jgi:hypothetical protein
MLCRHYKFAAQQSTDRPLLNENQAHRRQNAIDKFEQEGVDLKATGTCQADPSGIIEASWAELCPSAACLFTPFGEDAQEEDFTGAQRTREHERWPPPALERDAAARSHGVSKGALPTSPLGLATPARAVTAIRSSPQSSPMGAMSRRPPEERQPLQGRFVAVQARRPSESGGGRAEQVSPQRAQRKESDEAQPSAPERRDRCRSEKSPLQPEPHHGSEKKAEGPVDGLLHLGSSFDNRPQLRARPARKQDQLEIAARAAAVAMARGSAHSNSPICPVKMGERESMGSSFVGSQRSMESDQRSPMKWADISQCQTSSERLASPRLQGVSKEGLPASPLGLTRKAQVVTAIRSYQPTESPPGSPLGTISSRPLASDERQPPQGRYARRPSGEGHSSNNVEGEQQPPTSHRPGMCRTGEPQPQQKQYHDSARRGEGPVDGLKLQVVHLESSLGNIRARPPCESSPREKSDAAVRAGRGSKSPIRGRNGNLKGGSWHDPAEGLIGDYQREDGDWPSSPDQARTHQQQASNSNCAGPRSPLNLTPQARAQADRQGILTASSPPPGSPLSAMVRRPADERQPSQERFVATSHRPGTCRTGVHLGSSLGNIRARPPCESSPREKSDAAVRAGRGSKSPIRGRNGNLKGGSWHDPADGLIGDYQREDGDWPSSPDQARMHQQQASNSNCAGPRSPLNLTPQARAQADRQGILTASSLPGSPLSAMVRRPADERQPSQERFVATLARRPSEEGLQTSPRSRDSQPKSGTSDDALVSAPKWPGQKNIEFLQQPSLNSPIGCKLARDTASVEHKSASSGPTLTSAKHFSSQQSPRVRPFLRTGRSAITDWIITGKLGSGACGVVHSAKPMDGEIAVRWPVVAIKQVRQSCSPGTELLCFHAVGHGFVFLALYMSLVMESFFLAVYLFCALLLVTGGHRLCCGGAGPCERVTACQRG